ncbi:MAG: hypothetical protein GYA21_03865 [Myxococcales bacterium]|nr:hypothetical protein [Myxococcales bacterium]
MLWSAYLWAAFLFGSPPPALAGDPAQKDPDQESEKVRAAIQHGCVRECFILKDHDQYLSEKKRDERQQGCMRQCMDAAATRVAQQTALEPSWGMTKELAIEVCLPPGEHLFLSELRCASGQAPTFKRSGNVGPRNPMASESFDEAWMDPFVAVPKGKKDEHIVDRYEVVCADKTVILFFDMYHCGTPKPWAAPKGFTRPLPK